MGKFYERLGESLSLYVRYAAWLNTAPVKRSDKPEALPLTRRERLERDGAIIRMPPCDAEYLVAYLFEVGPVSHDGPLTHGELRAWQENTGIVLQSWEARTLHRLSSDYLAETYRARAPDCAAPWAEYARIPMDALIAKVKAAF